MDGSWSRPMSIVFQKLLFALQFPPTLPPVSPSYLLKLPRFRDFIHIMQNLPLENATLECNVKNFCLYRNYLKLCLLTHNFWNSTYQKENFLIRCMVWVWCLYKGFLYLPHWELCSLCFKCEGFSTRGIDETDNIFIWSIRE